MAGTLAVLMIFWSLMIYDIINENKEKINEEKLKNIREELASRIIVVIIFVLSVIGYYIQKELG